MDHYSMTSPRPDRIQCAVIGCKRTVARLKFPAAGEVICGKCGLRVKATRNVYRRAQRHHRKHPTPHTDAVLGRLWSRFKKHAIEASMGIG